MPGLRGAEAIMAGSAYRYRPRDIRRLVRGVEVLSNSDGSMTVLPNWISPAGGFMTRARLAIWIADTLNDKLEGRARK